MPKPPTLAVAGGVGSLAAQLARRAGARVLGIASDASADFLRSVGVEPVAYGDGLADRPKVLAAVYPFAALHDAYTELARRKRTARSCSPSMPRSPRMTGDLGGHTRGMALHIRSATALVSRTALCAILAATAIVSAPHAARADLRYCNETGHEAQLSEGHANGGDGMTVKGTFVVRNGTCAVLVPGPLNVRRYYVHIEVNGYSIGSKTNMLCVFPMRHYEIAKQDSPGFACRGKAFPNDAVHFKGFVNVAMRLEPFVAIDTQGLKNVTLTQRSDYSIR